MPFGDQTFWRFAVHSGWTMVPNKVWMVLNQSHRHFVSLPENFTKKTHIKLLNISFQVFELFHKCLRLIQTLKRYPPFVKERDLTRSPVEYFIKPCHNFSFICTGKTPKRWNPTMYSAFQTLQIVSGLKQCQERSASLRSYPASVQLPSQLIISPYLRVIMVHLYAATLRLLAAIFWPLSSSEQIPPLSSQITTSLRTTLCWRQPWNTKGSSWQTSGMFRWNILVRRKDGVRYFYNELQIN